MRKSIHKNQFKYSFLFFAFLFSIAGVGKAQLLGQEGTKLVGTNPIGYSPQGEAVAISADGNTAIVGSSQDNGNIGAVWFYTRNGTSWSQQGPKMTGNDMVGTPRQGYSVSISADGNTAVVGGYLDSNPLGAATVYTRTNGVWSQQGPKLVGSGSTTSPIQGWSVSISGDGNTIMVGGQGDNNYQGAVWVFVRSGGVWAQQGNKITALGGLGTTAVGQSVSLSHDGNTAIVGAKNDNSNTGAAFIFTRTTGVWSQPSSGKLVGSAFVGQSWQGQSVGISGDGNTAIIGGYLDNSHTGAAWVFTRSGDNWTQEGSKLVGNDYVGPTQQGSSVSLSYDGNRALVSGWNDNSAMGCAWLYTRTAGIWTQSGSKMKAGDNIGIQKFGTGSMISADGNNAIFGGPYDNGSVGAAWIFSDCTSAPPKAAITGATSQIICSGYMLSVTDTSDVGKFISSYLWSDGSTKSTSNPITTPGTYTVTITNSCGYSATASQIITTVNESPVTTITGLSYFCSGSATILTASDAANTVGPLTYNWSNGSTVAASNPITAIGTYTVNITNGFGCTVAASQAMTNNPISVSSTVGSAACYTTLRAAFDAINNGLHTGEITILVLGNSTETSTCILNASGIGAASYTRILMQPSGGAARTITGGLSNFPLIDLNGADNVLIDGLNTNGNSLSFINTSVAASVNTSTIRLYNDASDNKITNCTILGNSAVSVGSTGGGTIFIGTGTVTGNDNNTISYCNISSSNASSNATKHINVGGTAGIENDNLLIDHNNIYNYFRSTLSSTGIEVRNYSNKVIISNNKFYQTTAKTFTSVNLLHRAISIDAANGGGFEIINNIIGYSDSLGTGKYVFNFSSATSTIASFVPIYLNVNTTVPSSVQGNTIAGMTIAGYSTGVASAAPFKGIYVLNGLVNIGDEKGNTIGSMLDNSSITFSSTGASCDVTGIFLASTSNIITNNNKIGGITISSSNANSRNFYGIRSTGTSNSWICNNNIIGGEMANSISVTTTDNGTKMNGIINTGGSGSFTGNTIRNMRSSSGNAVGMNAALIGINLLGASSQTVSQNKIYNLATTSATATEINGIEVNSTGTNLVERNFIHGLSSSANTLLVSFNGIRIDNGTGTYKNNMIALGEAVVTAVNINGFNETNGSNNIWNNSVYIGGSPSNNSSNTKLFALSSSLNNNTRSIRNNIFYNARSSSSLTINHSCISLSSTDGLTINNNLYYSTGTGSSFGQFNNTDIADLNAWQTATNQDANSIFGNPNYADTSAAIPNLRINSGLPSVVDAEGADLGIEDDFDGQTRAILTPTDIGANAFIINYCVWTGAVNTQWSDAGNWSCALVPSDSTNVIIPANVTNMPVVDIVNATCKDLSIASTANLSIPTLSILNINGATINNGTFSVLGKVKFSGTTQTIPAGDYANMEINGTGTKTLGGAVTVNSILTLNSSTVQLGTNDLVLIATASIAGANSSSYIVTDGTGALKQQGIGNTGRTGAINFPVGTATSFTPLTINNIGTSDEFSVRVINNVFDTYDVNDNPTGTAQTVNNVDRTWIVKETILGGSNVTLGFQWNTIDELPSFTRAVSRASHYTNEGWKPGPITSASGVDPYTISLSGITTFSPFGIGSNLTVLPLKLVSFTGKETAEGITLQWVTANEINVAGFEIERSTDGFTFTAIGMINVQSTHNYNYLDNKTTTGTKYFYRLKIKDNDGAFKYSSVISFAYAGRLVAEYLVYPNPVVSNYLYVKPSTNTANALVTVVDMNGHICYTTKLNVATMNNGRLEIPVSKFKAGVYVLRILNQNGENVQVTKFTVLK